MKMKMKIMLAAVAALAVSLMTGCVYTRSTTQINTPAVYSIGTGTNGITTTNLVEPAKVTTVTKKERIWLPEGYAFFQESDTYGINITMTSASSSLPNIKAGVNHESLRWVPTGTNQIYAPPLTASGSVDNKAVPFWMSSKGQFTSGQTAVTQATDTNGVTGASATAIVPGTPATQQK